MYCIPLKNYKDKISNKYYFVIMILDSLKVISEKPQVHQVVPYMTSTPVPKVYNPEWLVRVKSDASGTAVGAVLKNQ